MKIAIGSYNPVKIAAARNVLPLIYPQAEIVPVEVDPGVSFNPLDDEEAIAGARERARQAKMLTNADLGIGLEGACTTICGLGMTAGWGAVYDGKRFYIGGGGHILLPPSVTRSVFRGEMELGTAMDKLTGGENTKQKMGAIGILTRGLSSRQRAYELILKYTMAPLISPQWYKNNTLRTTEDRR